MIEEAVAYAAEKVGEHMIDLFDSKVAHLVAFDDRQRASIFAFAAIATAMSVLAAAEVAPAEAAARLADVAAGIAGDLS